MSSGQQVIHGLHRQQNGKFCFRLLFRHGESEIQFLTAGDQILEDLIVAAHKDAKDKEDKDKPKTRTVTLKVTIGWRPD